MRMLWKSSARRRGGGFVFNPVHNIQSLVPLPNIVEMFKTAQEFGIYPIKG